MRSITLILLCLLCISSVLASTITGTVYTHELRIARYSLLSIDTVPQQRLILENGTYSIVVPPGTYTMKVVYSANNLQYEDELTVNATDDRTYNYDFILFPIEGNGTQVLPQIDDTVINVPVETQSYNIGWMPAAVLLVLLIIAAIYFSRRRWWEQAPVAKTEEKVVASEAPAVPADLEQVIAVIKAEGGRATQKELRRQIPCSEAKMSMMLTELEHKGKIERIKKGRGNLIVLKH